MASPEPADATIRALYGQVLIVSVPIESEGSTLGAYLLQLDPAATDSVPPVVWGIVAPVFELPFSLALRGIPMRNRQQPNALEKAFSPVRGRLFTAAGDVSGNSPQGGRRGVWRRAYS